MFSTKIKEDDPLKFKLAPHATEFGAGPKPGTLWDSESWLGMLNEMQEYEEPVSYAPDLKGDTMDGDPPPPPPPPPPTIKYFRIYSLAEDDEVYQNPAAAYEEQAQIANPLIELLEVEGVEPGDMSSDVARRLTDRSLNEIDPGLVSMTSEHSFYFLDVDDTAKGQKNLDWIGVDLGKDGDFDAFLGYKSGSDDLPVFVTISAEPLHQSLDALASDGFSETLF